MLKAEREYDLSFDSYLEDIRVYPLLSVERERELGRRIMQGDEGAVNELAKSNLRFVVRVAKKYQNRGLPLTDLVAEGNVGLLVAARRFDPSEGARFITYAVWWIRQAILKALSRCSEVRVKSSKAQAPVYIRLDNAAYDDASKTFHEFFTDERDETKIFFDKEEIKARFEALDGRERLVIAEYFGLADGVEKTLGDLGEMLGITREAIRQIRDRALEKMRQYPDLQPVKWKRKKRK